MDIPLYSIYKMIKEVQMKAPVQLWKTMNSLIQLYIFILLKIATQGHSNI